MQLHILKHDHTSFVAGSVVFLTTWNFFTSYTASILLTWGWVWFGKNMGDTKKLMLPIFILRSYSIILQITIPTKLDCNVSPKGCLKKESLIFVLQSLNLSTLLWIFKEFLTPSSPFSLQFRVIRCFGVGSSFMGSATNLREKIIINWNVRCEARSIKTCEKLNFWIWRTYMQVPEAVAPTGISMVTVVFASSGSGLRTICN